MVLALYPIVRGQTYPSLLSDSKAYAYKGRSVITVVSTKQPLPSVLLAQPPSLLPQLAKPRLAVGFPRDMVSLDVVLDDLQGTVLRHTTFLQHRCDQQLRLRKCQRWAFFLNLFRSRSKNN